MYWYGHGMSGWGFALATLTQVLFWGLLIAGIIALVRSLARGSALTRSDPEQLLAGRFARGGIDEDEYRRDLAMLREQRRTGRDHRTEA